MGAPDREEGLLRSVAFQNAESILRARQRAEEDLIRAKEALEHRTEELARSVSLMRATLESTNDAILVADNDGRITEFNARFSICTASSSSSPTRPRRSPAPNMAPSDSRELIRRILADRNADVLTAASASEALRVLKSRQPHILVSDIGMPEVDGYQFIRQVRSLPPDLGGNIPAIALTAFARSAERTRAMMAGYQMHIAKPVEPHELIATVANFAGRNA